MISSAVEGLVDEVVMRRLLLYAGAIPGPVYGRQGKAYLRQHIARYNAAARHNAWAVLIDLDSDAVCAPTLQEKWLASACLEAIQRSGQRIHRFLRIALAPIVAYHRQPMTISDAWKGGGQLCTVWQRFPLRSIGGGLCNTARWYSLHLVSLSPR